MTQPSDPARQRFVALIALRFAAALLIILGMAVALESLDLVGADMAKPVGLTLIIIGMLDLMIVIPMLARRWRSVGPDRS